MKPYFKFMLVGVALLAIAAVGTQYYETLPGLVIKHPVTGAVTAHINGTNGTVTAGAFVGDGSGLTGVSGLGDPAVITSHLADSSTNAALIVDTASDWTTPLAAYFVVKEHGTNSLAVGLNGGITIGRGTTNLWGDAAGDFGESFLSWRDPSVEPNGAYNDFMLGSGTNINKNFQEFDAQLGEKTTFWSLWQGEDSTTNSVRSKMQIVNQQFDWTVGNNFDLSDPIYHFDYQGNATMAGTASANNVYVTNDCSALTFTDRSRSPTNVSEAYAIVASHKTKDGKVDHSMLHSAAWGKTKTGTPDQSTRDLGMVISAQQMVIQDLVSRIEKLEKK